ncbi:MAG TPA: hypothetical protein VK082_02520 [Paenalcaligenes sp.]|nr:hypothetical protein [Paenalcaligenes sp.]
MCYSSHSHFFTLQQLRATTQAGGVSGVVLKAQGDAFFIEIEMRSGDYAVLVTARKEPRRFKNPLRALAILRDIGIVNGQFDLSLYAPEQLNTNYQPATAKALFIEHKSSNQNQATASSKARSKSSKAAVESTTRGLQQMKLL